MTESLAEDWIALWQSEMTAMAADRELRESWAGLLALWASAASAAMQLMPRQANDVYGGTANRAAGAAKPPGTAPAATASEFGGDEARRLFERIAELESRLAAFERGESRPPGSEPARSGDD